HPLGASSPRLYVWHHVRLDSPDRVTASATANLLEELDDVARVRAASPQSTPGLAWGRRKGERDAGYSNKGERTGLPNVFQDLLRLKPHRGASGCGRWT